MRNIFTYDQIESWAKRNLILVILFIILMFISSAVTILDGGRKLVALYQTTIGRKALNYEKIDALAAQTNIDYFATLFGSATFKNRKGKYLEYVFIDRDFYVLAVTDNEGKVLLYSVTTRSKDFNPKLNLGYLSSNDRSFFVVLGKTIFKDIPIDPLKITSNQVMHDMLYKEKYYFGNPGLYQNYMIAFCGVGVESNKLPFLDDVMYEAKLRQGSVEPMNGQLSAPLMKFREVAIVNTFSVSEPFSNIDEEISICPDEDQVRLLRKNN